MPKKFNVVVVTGPTATGKTALAVELARRWNGEVISADSRQVYPVSYTHMTLPTTELV